MKIRRIVGIMIGSAIMGFGINAFNLSNGLVEGGITGLALLLKYVLGWDPSYVSVVINIPLLLLGWKYMGKTSFQYALIGCLALPLFLTLFESVSVPVKDPLLASLYAGAFVGVGLGIVFRYDGMTDGVDVIAKLCQTMFGWSLGRTIFLTDAIVIAASLIYLDVERAMYTLVAIVIGSRLIDWVQEGTHSAKAVTVISASPDVIAERILADLKRGVTYLNGKGAFTSEFRDVLYCIISRKEIGRLKQIVKETDPRAFVIVNDVHEVLGNGWEAEK
jgi:uncharacterized membrane-anchored protein YitT (DUF2179 family)